MEYVWIVMLAIVDLIWIVYSTIDIIRTIKNRDKLDFITKACIAFHLIMLFITSFFQWTFSQIM